MADLVRRMCLRKRRFADEIDARLSMLNAALRLRTYRCPHCAGWHLTKAKKQ